MITNQKMLRGTMKSTNGVDGSMTVSKTKMAMATTGKIDDRSDPRGHCRCHKYAACRAAMMCHSTSSHDDSGDRVHIAVDERLPLLMKQNQDRTMKFPQRLPGTHDINAHIL